jgi:hypothetical protein
VSAASGCADGCLPSWIDDAECDEVCNNEACGYDGMDCDAPTGECYSDINGTDYRGSVSKTKSGLECQLWSHQSPQQHTKTHLNFPDDGLGGHNHCRNPGREKQGPWCFTTNPSLRFELCEVSPPQATCSPAHTWAKVETALVEAAKLYYTLCPRDCEALLGDGRCDLDCNITSCAHDKGDCQADGRGPVSFQSNATDCPMECRTERKLGDSNCDRECYTSACGWDKGDCEAGRGRNHTPREPFDRCADGCLPTDIHDATCDEVSSRVSR